MSRIARQASLAGSIALLVACTTERIVQITEPAIPAEAEPPASDATALDAGERPPVEAAANLPSGGVCSPKDVSQQQISTKPARPRQRVCSDEQLKAIAPCALGYGTKDECARFISGPKEDTDCTRCISSRAEDPSWGAVVREGKMVFLNWTGCVELLDPSYAECSRVMREAISCVNAACNECFLSPSESPADQAGCASAAAKGGCQLIHEKSLTCRASIAATQSPAEVCLTDTWEVSDFLRVAPAFCGK